MNQLQILLGNNVHLGHSIKKWNSKMFPYIYSEKNGIYVIDVLQTLICLKFVSAYLVSTSKKKFVYLLKF